MKIQIQTASEVKNSNHMRTLANETREKKEKNIFPTTVMFSTLLILIVAIFFVGCEREENEPLDEAILNSTELEEYIIAGAALQQSLAIFTDKLNKIDFSTLEVAYNVDGWDKVVYLPTTVGSCSIEEKIQEFNETKKTLCEKFPHFTSFSEVVSREYFQKSIQNSVNVSSKLLELGIITKTKKLKSGTTEINYTNDCQVMAFLHSWVNNNSNYVEVIIIKYSDGTWLIYIDAANTSTESFIDKTQVKVNGVIVGYKHNNKTVSDFGHTHIKSATPTPKKDDPLPGVFNFIYYNYMFHYYH